MQTTTAELQLIKGRIVDLLERGEAPLRLRFHLGAGENFGKWQIACDGATYYFDPAAVTLRLYGCKLRNQPGTACKIFEGANKTVCAWVDCERIEIWGADPDDILLSVPGHWDIARYNPKRAPFWHDSTGRNMDNERCPMMISSDRLLHFWAPE